MAQVRKSLCSFGPFLPAGCVVIAVTEVAASALSALFAWSCQSMVQLLDMHKSALLNSFCTPWKWWHRSEKDKDVLCLQRHSVMQPFHKVSQNL